MNFVQNSVRAFGGFTQEAESDILRFLTHYYNRVRLHSFNDYRTPVAVE